MSETEYQYGVRWAASTDDWHGTDDPEDEPYASEAEARSAAKRYREQLIRRRPGGAWEVAPEADGETQTPETAPEPTPVPDVPTEWVDAAMVGANPGCRDDAAFYLRNARPMIERDVLARVDAAISAEHAEPCRLTTAEGRSWYRASRDGLGGALRVLRGMRLALDDQAAAPTVPADGDDYRTRYLNAAATVADLSARLDRERREHDADREALEQARRRALPGPDRAAELAGLYWRHLSAAASHRDPNELVAVAPAGTVAAMRAALAELAQRDGAQADANSRLGVRQVGWYCNHEDEPHDARTHHEWQHNEDTGAYEFVAAPNVYQSYGGMNEHQTPGQRNRRCPRAVPLLIEAQRDGGMAARALDRLIAERGNLLDLVRRMVHDLHDERFTERFRIARATSYDQVTAAVLGDVERAVMPLPTEARDGIAGPPSDQAFSQIRENARGADQASSTGAEDVAAHLSDRPTDAELAAVAERLAAGYIGEITPELMARIVADLQRTRGALVGEQVHRAGLVETLRSIVRESDGSLLGQRITALAERGMDAHGGDALAAHRARVLREAADYVAANCPLGYRPQDAAEDLRALADGAEDTLHGGEHSEEDQS